MYVCMLYLVSQTYESSPPPPPLPPERVCPSVNSQGTIFHIWGRTNNAFVRACLHSGGGPQGGEGHPTRILFETT